MLRPSMRVNMAACLHCGPPRMQQKLLYSNANLGCWGLSIQLATGQALLLQYKHAVKLQTRKP